VTCLADVLAEDLRLIWVVEVGVVEPRLVYTSINLTLTFNSRGLSDNLLLSC